MFQLESDTLHKGVRGNLFQKQGEEWVVIGYHSKRLPTSAKNFGVTELELTGLLVNIHRFMQLSCNWYFEVLVDHKAIKYMVKSKTEKPTTRLKTLLLKLSEYTIDLKYQKGSESHTGDFAIDTINLTYSGCTGMYLDVAGHMLAFYGKKTNPRAGLLHGQGVTASKAITNIPTWMGYFTRWRVQCASVSEASEILVGYNRLEKENLRQAHWELQNWFSSMQLDSTLSAAA